MTPISIPEVSVDIVEDYNYSDSGVRETQTRDHIQSIDMFQQMHHKVPQELIPPLSCQALPSAYTE